MHQQSLLPSTWQIPDEIRQRLGDEPGRQRVIQAHGHLLLVLHAPPHAEETEREGRYLWRQPDGRWTATGGPSGPTALDDLLDEYATIITELDKAEDAAQSAQQFFDVMPRLTPLHRSVGNLHNTLQDARKAAPADRRLILARDRAYSLMRQAEILQADAKNGLDVAIARRAEQQARSSHQMAVAAHRLNLMVGFFFPLATLMAVFGANLGHGLEIWDATWAPLPLLAVLGSGLLLGVVITLVMLSQARHAKSQTLPQ